MNEDSWGPWIDHDGKGCPAAVRGRLVRAVAEFDPGAFREVEEIVPTIGTYEGCNVWDWRFWGVSCACMGIRIPRVVRYRLHEPKAMQQIRDLLNAPEEVTEDA